MDAELQAQLAHIISLLNALDRRIDDLATQLDEIDTRLMPED